MKRWQDRGEVQDSDDEELSFENVAQSLERPRKRLRLAGDVENEEEGSSVAAELQDNDEDEDWLEPKVPTTYGKRTRALRYVSIDDAVSEPDHDRDDAVPKPSYLPGLTRSLATQEANVGTRSSQSNQSEDLPDIERILAKRKGSGECQQDRETEVIATAESSPLSEREVSPPAPAAFHFPRLGHGLDQSPSPRHEDLSYTFNVVGDDELPDEAPAAVGGTRSLRARQEKQLHPYMFDKAQYQQQCRERGLRPVRYVEAIEHTAETQDASLSGDESDSQAPFFQSSSSPAKPSSILGDDPPLSKHQGTSDPNVDIQNQGTLSGDDDLPDLQSMFRYLTPGGVRRDFKRRKLYRISHPHNSAVPGSNAIKGRDQHDSFSVPPSPPPTSSDSAVARSADLTKASFRMPRGLTPGPLPTPQISSETRQAQHVLNDDLSDAELPSAKLRSSTMSRHRTQTIDIDSSNESSDSESESESAKNQTRMQRERRRIKGVLPASWLKIDLQAQRKQTSPSPSRRRNPSSPSPQRTGPQKGVAQRVTSKTVGSPGRVDVVSISDDASEADSRHSSPSPPKMNQSKLQFGRKDKTTAPSDFVDIDRMEVDWIDPMLTGSPRLLSKPTKKSHQPRIKDAFGKAERSQPDVSEERKVLRHAHGATSNRGVSGKQRAGRRPWKRPLTQNLSILDAPEGTEESKETLAPFVRLAIRNARARPDCGRHSPTRKHIRLSTREDTETATTTLRAWREGTIAPRPFASDTRKWQVANVTTGGHAPEAENPPPRSRTPLTELASNVQSKLHGPLRIQVHKQTRPIGTAVRRPRMQQTRLQPALMKSNENILNPRDEQVQQPPSTKVNERLRKLGRNQPQSPRYRGAQLESLEDEFDHSHRAAAFERRMHLLTESVARDRDSRNVDDFQMARFLQSSVPRAMPQEPRSISSGTPKRYQQQQSTTHAPELTLPHRARKRQPQRIDVDAREYRQPSEPLPEVIDIDNTEEQTTSVNGPFLRGLGPFGTRYATDFDILPLSVGTYFHESSFIGSGDFAASLNFAGRDLDTPTGRITIHLEGDVLVWGAWTEDVAAGLSRIPSAISDAIRSLTSENEVHLPSDSQSLVLLNIDYLLRSVVRYLSRCLAFLDPVDRVSCVQRLHSFIEDILEAASEPKTTKTMTKEIQARCSQYAIIFAKQSFRLSGHALVDQALKARCVELLSRAARRLASCLFPGCLADLRTFCEDNRHASKRESGIRDSNTPVSGAVVLYHSLKDLERPNLSFWSTVIHSLHVDVSTLCAVVDLDKSWYDVFTLLPLQEIDAHGNAQIGSRIHGTPEDWSLVKKLIIRLFELYAASSGVRGSTINDYVRASLKRCYRLVTTWGWWRCETILGTIFDFFARRGLAQLHKEESWGSPRFLEELDLQPSFDVQPEDRSFHIFLKLLASGLQGIRKNGVYSDKKIGGIAWRFIPNHGRTHRKDTEVLQEDLDALRNHHDLLSTLYYASPPGQRPRVELLRNLVDHSASHREACRLNIRAWANVASFQMSTNETLGQLDTLISWYREVMTMTISQYRLARTEVERDVASARVEGKALISNEMVEDTIARNQRQVSATLIDALAAMRRALQSSNSLEKACHLLDGSAFWQVFDLFESFNRRLHAVLDEALAVLHTALQVQTKFERNRERQQVSDDSQDYGDLSALQEMTTDETTVLPANSEIVDILHKPVGQLVSDVFGADGMTDDTLLIKVIDVWTKLAGMTVGSGKRSWSSYINDYTSDAWSQLRDTDQRRKFTPYFLACLVKCINIDKIESSVFTSWFTSLVEREANLKFQHVLTNVLLNRHSDEPLIQNLPFACHTSGRFEISLQELRQRRLSLLSSVLSNMRLRFDSVMLEDPHMLPGLRSTYADILKQLMQSMKKNYQQLDTSHHEQVADVQAKGAYVEFVQQVVSFMQQYTTDICQVDRFFTDSAAFPLPVTDPTYVVGRLRGYVPRLLEDRKRKELAVFVQSVSERAAVDGQQKYLVDQLASAMGDVFERGSVQAPSLQHVLMTAVFPRIH